MVLIMLTGALLPGHAGEVQAAVTVGQGRLVQVDRLGTIHQPHDWTFADPVQDVGIADVDQAVWAFYRRVLFGLAFGALDGQVSHECLYCWSSA